MEKRFFARLVIVFIFIGLAICNSYAQEQKADQQTKETVKTNENPTNKPVQTADQPPTKPTKTPQDILKEEEDKNKFLGLSFGVSLAATLNFGENPSIDEAEIINGYVYVLKEAKAYARVMLESHYFFQLKSKLVGLGPFMAIQPTSGDLIGTLAGGAMIGFKKEGTDNNSFNVGLGLFVANDLQELTAGLVEGQKAPEGISVVKYKKRTVVGPCLIFSFSFKI